MKRERKKGGSVGRYLQSPVSSNLTGPTNDLTSARARVGDERARPALIRALDDEDDGVRLWAACGLRRVGDESAVEALIKALSDPYGSVREQAVLALAKRGDNRAVKPLLEVLDDEAVRVQEAARFTLRVIFGVDVGRDYEKAKKQMKEHSHEQRCLNEKLETVLDVIIKMEQATGVVRDEDLYHILETEHDIDKGDATRLIIKLLKKGFIHSPRRGYTQICV